MPVPAITGDNMVYISGQSLDDRPEMCPEGSIFQDDSTGFQYWVRSGVWYQANFKGLSTDIKPIDVVAYAWFHEEDTDEDYQFINSVWVLQPKAEPIPDPTPDPETLQHQVVDAVQNVLDTTARTRNYDGILSLCSYAVSTHPVFGPEGLAGVAWRDEVWSACYQILADVQNEVRSIPTVAEVLAEIPAMVWP